VKFILFQQLLLTPCDFINLKNRISIEQIKSRLNVLHKIISAFREAEASGIKDPIKILKNALSDRAYLKVEKSRLKKPRD
jgi:hypothetical protein